MSELAQEFQVAAHAALGVAPQFLGGPVLVGTEYQSEHDHLGAGRFRHLEGFQ
ncbi:hypothetical protein ACQP1G_24625 [Nocardia sp. CA-107356]|uniref:hypothetical protein n=1 Tax=Nocardia sp. CA-107356 TaxID=3239972 RepID=UPI003D91129C